MTNTNHPTTQKEHKHEWKIEMNAKINEIIDAVNSLQQEGKGKEE